MKLYKCVPKLERLIFLCPQQPFIRHRNANNNDIFMALNHFRYYVGNKKCETCLLDIIK